MLSFLFKRKPKADPDRIKELERKLGLEETKQERPRFSDIADAVDWENKHQHVFEYGTGSSELCSIVEGHIDRFGDVLTTGYPTREEAKRDLENAIEHAREGGATFNNLWNIQAAGLEFSAQSEKEAQLSELCNVIAGTAATSGLSSTAGILTTNDYQYKNMRRNPK